MNEYRIYLLLGAILVMLAFVIFGSLTSRNLPPEKRKFHVRKFTLIGLAVLLFCLPIFKPFVYSYSQAKHIETKYVGKLDSIEQVSEYQAKQEKDIRLLKEDVMELKEDLYQVNLYYSTILHLFSTMIAVLCLSFAFRKPENDSSENKLDQIFKS